MFRTTLLIAAVLLAQASVQAFLAPAGARLATAHTSALSRSRCSAPATLRMASLADRNTAAVDLAAAPITTVTTAQEYHKLLAENPDKLVVFKWHAPWCRSCKAMDLKYRRLAIERPDVIFADIDVFEAKELKKQHGVSAVPAVHMHAGHLGLVENFSCGPSKVPLLVRRIEMYADVAAYVTKAKGGLMEKLAAFSAGVAKRVPIPSVPSTPMTSSKGIMERLNDMAARGDSSSSGAISVSL